MNKFLLFLSLLILTKAHTEGVWQEYYISEQFDIRNTQDKFLKPFVEELNSIMEENSFELLSIY